MNNELWTVIQNKPNQTQTNPTCGEQAQRIESIYSEFACPELVEWVEPILPASGGPILC